MKRRNRIPKGWNENGVREVLEHYESQTEEEAVAEDEAAFRGRDQAVMVVPKRSITANLPRTTEITDDPKNDHS